MNLTQYRHYALCSRIERLPGEDDSATRDRGHFVRMFIVVAQGNIVRARWVEISGAL